MLLDEFEFLARVVDEGAKLFFLSLTQGGAEYFIYFAFDGAGGIFENMLKASYSP